MEEFIATLCNYLVRPLNLFQMIKLHFYTGERNTLKLREISLYCVEATLVLKVWLLRLGRKGCGGLTLSTA